jgi:hypothetical protein
MSATPPLLLRHAGPFTSDVVVTRGRELKELPGLSPDARHRLFASFVELAQNIARYSAERSATTGEDRGVGEITLAAGADGLLRLTATNAVPAATAETLAARLSTLAGLDAAGLKQLHRERRRAGPPPGSLGAGLGLIELARHAAAPLSHASAPLSDGLVNLSLTVPLDPASGTP